MSAVAEVDRMLLEAEVRLEVLRDLRRRLGPETGPAARPVKQAGRPAPAREVVIEATPPVASPVANVETNGHGIPKTRTRKTPEQHMLAIAQWVKLNGPCSKNVAITKLGVGSSTMYGGFSDRLTESGYFELETDGYHLTAEGRNWLASQPSPRS